MTIARLLFLGATAVLTGSDTSAVVEGIVGPAEIGMGIPPAGAGNLGTGGMGLPSGGATGGLY